MGNAVWLALLGDQVPYLIAAMVLLMGVERALAPVNVTRKRRRGPLVLIAFYLVLSVLAGALGELNPAIARDVRLAGLVCASIAMIWVTAAVVFDVVLPRVRINVPPILQDVLISASSLVAIFALAARVGVNLSGLFATSAVLTAVVGLSMQDTLGNIMGGLALQVDNSVSVGDWIKVGEVQGRVVEIRWRYTAIETRNWETVLLPNSSIVKGQVTVLGRRMGQPVQWRRFVYFFVDAEHSPTEIIAAIDTALQSLPIACVALEPRAHCLFMDVTEGGTAKYAVRYWLTDIAKDSPTDSVIRSRVHFALKRIGISFSSSPTHVLLTQTAESREARGRDDFDRRLAALTKVDLFEALSDEERRTLAASLRAAPFARGELITKQGAASNWLYMVARGDAAARVKVEGAVEREVARFGPGDFFGEMSLLTGEPRAASVVAVTDVECYRLDKETFRQTLASRPELAEQVAGVLAHRKTQNTAARAELSQEAEKSLVSPSSTDFLGKVRSFLSGGG
jgi:small-conductance mechanosensitive channel/CRP-like cAMP-binding protein